MTHKAPNTLRLYITIDFFHFHARYVCASKLYSAWVHVSDFVIKEIHDTRLPFHTRAEQVHDKGAE